MCSKFENRIEQRYSQYRIFIALSHLYYLHSMSILSERIEWLTQEFDALIESLHVSHNPEERKLLLRRMRFLIVEIDTLISSHLKRDSQASPAPNQPKSES